MLATVLGGIAVGSYIAAPVMRWVSRSPAALAAIELAVAMAGLLSVYLLSRTYDVADAISGIVGSTDADGLGFMLVASALAIVPATVLMGVAFPVGLYLFTGDARPGDDEVGRRVGIFYACNVAGGIVGSLLAGFVLVPTIGARRSIIVLAALLLVSGLLLATVVGSRRTRISLAAGSTALFVLLALFAVPDPYEAALAHRYPRERVLWLEEGVQTTVSIHQTRGGRVMYLDGLGQANDAPAVADFHRLIGTLPMALHPDPERALVVGLGGGVTAGAISSQPGVDVDVVELSSTVVDGARFFSHVNEGVVDGENVDMRIDDGRNYLLVTEDKYDVITADIILPEHAGAGKLWSVEYWELTRDALADDGIMLQWVPSHRSHDEYEMVLRSFLEVYPDATLWAGGSLLVGTKSPLVLDRADFDRKVADPATREYYAAANLGSFAALLYHYSAGPDDVRAAIGDGPLLTDDHPRIEYFRSLDVDPAPANPSKITGHVRDILPQ
jgi:spermidine synthase